MDAYYLIMLIMMFIHNMYSTFKISVQFIINKIKKSFYIGWLVLSDLLLTISL